MSEVFIYYAIFSSVVMFGFTHQSWKGGYVDSYLSGALMIGFGCISLPILIGFLLYKAME